MTIFLVLLVHYRCGAVVVMNKLKSLRSSDEEFSSLRIAFVLTWLDLSPLVTLADLEYVILEC